MPLSSYAANQVADDITTSGYFASTLYLALCTDSPDSSMTGTTLATVEPADGSYYRPSFPDWNWSTPSSGVTTYDTQIDLTVASDWGNVSYFAICDAATAGNMIWFGSLATSFYVYASGTTVSYVPAGYIRLTVT